MKQLMLVIGILLNFTLVFAQTSAELIEKGKKYEAENEYVYAMSCYYDAVAIGDENIELAYNSYMTLEKSIENGNPGPGEFDDFSLYDGWLSLLKNAEKYATEYIPYIIYFPGTFEKGEINYENRTAKYYAKVEFDHSAKYERIYEVIKTGLRKSHRKDWKSISQEWPKVSVFFDESKGFLQESSALARIPGDKTFMCPWNRVDVVGKTMYGTYARESESRTVPVDLKVALYDENGNKLIESKRALVCRGWIEFSDVPANVMKLIDSNKVSIKLIAAYLEYGEIGKSNIINYSYNTRDWVKSMLDLKLDLAKVIVVNDEIAYKSKTDKSVIRLYEDKIKETKEAEEKIAKEKEQAALEEKRLEEERIANEKRIAAEKEAEAKRRKAEASKALKKLLF